MARLVCLQIGHYFAHADGTPFLWIGDTAWNGPLRASTEDWAYYLALRRRQGFTAVQWVTTQWRAASSGDEHGTRAYSGTDSIAIEPAFFQRLDNRIQALCSAGFLSVPVLLWANDGASEAENQRNPGYQLPEAEVIRLARYMVARWGTHPTVWILAGDADFEKEDVASRWRRIGRAVFDDSPHAPVTVHPISVQWTTPVFGSEGWFDFVGYQSGHGDSDAYVAWLVKGPPARGWQEDRVRPIINLEPPYEGHVAYHSHRPFDAAQTRKRLYWSLLVSPPAGVTYGGHGVWAWDDGTSEPEAHDGSGVPLPWRSALEMPAAEQVAILARLFQTMRWWELRPAQHMLAVQPGDEAVGSYVAAAQSDEALILYAPEGVNVQLRATSLPKAWTARWMDPRSGTEHDASHEDLGDRILFALPTDEDWVLTIHAASIGAPQTSQVQSENPNCDR